MHRMMEAIGGMAQRDENGRQAARFQRGDLLRDEGFGKPGIALEDDGQLRA
jgi:hypothetical protein